MLVDTLACALGGYTSEPSKLAPGMVRTIHNTQSATILWSGERTSVDLATFANGIMIRYLDYNDFNQAATVKDGGHPSDTFAAVLSPAELAQRDGKTVLLGAILAWEVMGRLTNAASIRSRGFLSSISDSDSRASPVSCWDEGTKQNHRWWLAYGVTIRRCQGAVNEAVIRLNSTPLARY